MICDFTGISIISNIGILWKSTIRRGGRQDEAGPLNHDLNRFELACLILLLLCWVCWVILPNHDFNDGV